MKDVELELIKELGETGSPKAQELFLQYQRQVSDRLRQLVSSLTLIEILNILKEVSVEQGTREISGVSWAQEKVNQVNDLISKLEKNLP